MLAFPPLESQSWNFEDGKENQDNPSSSVFLGQRQKPVGVEVMEGFFHPHCAFGPHSYPHVSYHPLPQNEDAP